MESQWANFVQQFFFYVSNIFFCGIYFSIGAICVISFYHLPWCWINIIIIISFARWALRESSTPHTESFQIPVTFLVLFGEEIVCPGGC